MLDGVLTFRSAREIPSFHFSPSLSTKNGAMMWLTNRAGKSSITK